MRFFEFAAIGIALASQATVAFAGHTHRHQHLHKLQHRRLKHSHVPRDVSLPVDDFGFIGREHPVYPPGFSPVERSLKESSAPEVEKRGGGSCKFPSDAGLIAVTPGQMNGGWALPPDQSCTAGNYCPYACPPGEMMAQWDPKATSYSYPASLHGGLYCNQDGTVSKPFSDKPYCMKGAGGIGAKDKTGKGCAFCQTVLPGSESMLIPTMVEGTNEITVPDTEYWCETAAHFYINPPGTSTDDGCVWGTPDKPIGNWSPYVAGANKDGTGNTFLKIGWNPKFTDGSGQFPIEAPNWGVEIECDGDGCNGLPCKIDPKVHKVNEIQGQGSSGAGGAAYCVVTVPEGTSANIVVFDGDGSSHSTPSAPPEKPSPPPAPKTTAKPTPTTTSTPTTSSTPTTTSTSTTSFLPSSTSTKKIYSAHIFKQNVTVSTATAASSVVILPTTEASSPSASPIETAASTGTAAKPQVQAAGFGLAAIAVVMAIAL